MGFEIIKYKSEEYGEMVALRNEILRKPLGLTFSEQDLEKDKNDLLLVYRCPDEGEITGCCILTPLNEHTVQLRQMAVASVCQGKGMGRELLTYAERIAREKGFECICLHARKIAIAFYQKQRYTIEGNEFLEVGIPHYEMKKAIIEY